MSHRGMHAHDHPVAGGGAGGGAGGDDNDNGAAATRRCLRLGLTGFSYNKYTARRYPQNVGHNK